MARFLVPWRLTAENNIPDDALIIGYFVSVNNLANACASTTICLKTDTVALALWGSTVGLRFGFRAVHTSDHRVAGSNPA